MSLPPHSEFLATQDHGEDEFPNRHDKEKVFTLHGKCLSVGFVLLHHCFRLPTQWLRAKGEILRMCGTLKYLLLSIGSHYGLLQLIIVMGTRED